jgi:hypothetical protein
MAYGICHLTSTPCDVCRFGSPVRKMAVGGHSEERSHGSQVPPSGALYLSSPSPQFGYFAPIDSRGDRFAYGCHTNSCWE